MKKMKQLIFAAALLIFTSANSNAQELQYSSSIFIELEGTSSNNSSGFEIIDSYTLVVEPGKTVKITGASVSRETVPAGEFSTYSNISLLINNKPLYYISEGETANILPIWLPEGSYVIALGGLYQNTTRAFVSGIEFNITQ